ncbi:conserved hypothetical protein, partial [Ricinus communis]
HLAVLVEEEQAQEGQPEVDQPVHEADAGHLDHVAGRMEAVDLAFREQMRQAVRLAQRGLPPFRDRVADDRQVGDEIRHRNAVGVGRHNVGGQVWRLARRLRRAQQGGHDENRRHQQGQQGGRQDAVADARAQPQVHRPCRHA